MQPYACLYVNGMMITPFLKLTRKCRVLLVILSMMLMQHISFAQEQTKLHDLMPAYGEYFKNKKQGDTIGNVQLFLKEVVEPSKDYYELIAPGKEEAFYKTYLQYVDGLLHKRIIELDSLFLLTFSSAQQTIHKRLSWTQKINPPVYKGLSLFSTNGQVRQFKGEYILVIGLDVESYIQGTREDLEYLIQHEYLHYLHAHLNHAVYQQINTSFTSAVNCPLYLQVFAEGLATYFPLFLNPQADPARFLQSHELAEKAPALKKEIANELLKTITSTDKKYQYQFFSIRHEKDRDQFPDRAGYYIGYEIIAHALKEGMSIEQLLKLNEKQIASLVTRKLKQIADEKDFKKIQSK